MSASLSKLKINKSILVIVATALVALIIVAGCMSVEKSVKKVSKAESPQVISKQTSIPQTGSARVIPEKLVIPKTGLKRLQASGIDQEQLQIIGQKIYKNETGGNVKNLIFWSVNESFPSLGVGHFIWFPEGRSIGFTESFPSMIRYLMANGASVPEWLSRQIQIGALWNSREQLEQERGRDKFQAL